MSNLRTHLQNLAAGNAPAPRGYAITPADVAASAPFATACDALYIGRNPFMDDDEDGNCEAVTAPSELLTPLP